VLHMPIAVSIRHLQDTEHLSAKSGEHVAIPSLE